MLISTRPRSRNPHRKGRSYKPTSFSEAVSELGYGGVKPLAHRKAEINEFTDDLDRSIHSISDKGQKDRQPGTSHSRYIIRRFGAIAILMISGAGLYKGVEAVSSFVDRKQEENNLYLETINPDALNAYNEGKIDPNKVTLVSATEDSTAIEFASKLHPSGDLRRPLDEIDSQSNANGIPGVQNGEVFVIPNIDIQKYFGE